MRHGLTDATNPLYYIVVLTTVIWAGALLALPLVSGTALFSWYALLVFANWAVLPVAMAFDVGILRQRFAVSAPISIALVVTTAIPGVAVLGGGAYILYRSRVVGSDR